MIFFDTANCRPNTNTNMFINDKRTDNYCLLT